MKTMKFNIWAYAIFLSGVIMACECPGGKEKLVITTVNDEVKSSITSAMEASADCWNKGDFEGYMKVYWQSDSMLFMGLSSITYGWQATLDRYKKGYPSADHRGELTYEFKHFNQLADDCVLVIGSFYLKRKMGDAEGNFSLIWKKVGGEWKIVVDHT